MFSTYLKKLRVLWIMRSFTVVQKSTTVAPSDTKNGNEKFRFADHKIVVSKIMGIEWTLNCLFNKIVDYIIYSRSIML